MIEDRFGPRADSGASSGIGPSATAQRFPRGMLAAGSIVGRLLRLGLPMGPLRLLETRGRRSGQVRRVPVALLSTGGERWLISPFGAVAWVHNVRANGEASLGRGGHLRPVRLREVDDDRVPQVLQTYRRRFAAVPFVRAAFEASGHDPIDRFVLEAHRHPVFRIEQSATATDLGG